MPPKSPNVRRVSPKLRAHAQTVRERLWAEYPQAPCALTHDSPYQLLVATILSAQCTDERVNMVTPAVFRRYPTPADLAAADPDELEGLVHTTGFFRAKARNLIAMAKDVDERFGGQIPTPLEDLITLGGVGRKTGNVIRSVAFHEPGLPVDTHVGRLSRRLGLTRHTDPVKVEFDLMPLLAPPEWGEFSLRLIQHGRRVCEARRPKCGECVLNDVCPSAS